jgi:hypothetical protein
VQGEEIEAAQREKIEAAQREKIGAAQREEIGATDESGAEGHSTGTSGMSQRMAA